MAKKVWRMFAERKNDLSSLARFFIGKPGFEFLIENKSHFDCKTLERLTHRVIHISDRQAPSAEGHGFFQCHGAVLVNFRRIAFTLAF
jgi:hypothetical protein